ncbi:DUF1499 domain-containing protein [Sinisalibacter aestuarii]|uniref:DUF1499 domain-containing protein n=1 Tax=Sinisalibacter aestuarii TaxID=2949426 RepID=A0ABQ5LS73_9RHOB|nr:DUF1499 domain-containing protein [Sinisalibacter aestuarii]GKY87857.1 hypothetical protein STA1M1_17260 [Sinisalibacter aestuarii]
MIFVKSLAVLLGLIVLLQAWIRLAPLPRARLTARPGPMEPGVHPMTGGVKIVRPLAELPPGALDRLAAIAAATPRTMKLGDDPLAFVTRSKLWGFPDIALIWSDGEHLHLHSHLVFGKGDMGVNAARAARWFEALERGEG